jgi:hypothetical protein
MLYGNLKKIHLGYEKLFSDRLLKIRMIINLKSGRIR